jgi:glycosyltransferase involved in cell wall biosynthesis
VALARMGFFSRLFSKPAKISLVHATRGRADRPLSARKLWLDAASKPERIEHVFAIDDDDEICKSALAEFKPYVVTEIGKGCVGAWNLAAEHSTGDILVQLSDDWLPLPGWDDLFEQRMGSLRKPKVLRISDGHRTDDLLCMAILNRKRMEQQGWFLPPAYTGIYSDDEFSFRAFDDDCLVDARDLVFTHEHPNYDSKIEMDETYRRQNDNAKYAEAKAIFLERNPEAKKRWFVKDHWERKFITKDAFAEMKKKAVKKS